MAVEDQERHTGLAGDVCSSLALFTLEVGGIQHHREAGAQNGGCHFMQTLVGGGTGIRVINAGSQLAGVVVRLIAEQALALDVGAHANGAQGLDQAHCHVALAHCRDTMVMASSREGMAL